MELDQSCEFFLLAIVYSGLVLLEAVPFYHDMVIGLLLLVSVLVDEFGDPILRFGISG